MMNSRKPATADDFLAAALSIAEALALQAEKGEAGMEFSGEQMIGTADSHRIVTGPVGPSFYEGDSGICWFLAMAAGYSTQLAEVAREGLRGALTKAQDLLGTGTVGLLDGAAGVSLAAVGVGRVLEDDDLIAGGHRLALDVAAARTDVDYPDLINGRSGICLAFVSLSEALGEPVLLEAAQQVAKELAATARREPWGISWPDPYEEGPALLGLAHGTSGPVLALLEAGLATGDQSLVGRAMEGMRYERSWFSREAVGWPDLRARAPGDSATDRLSYPSMWCHGATGIGISRLRAFRLTGDKLALAEASAAIQAARRVVVEAARAPSDACLCHGLAGAVELLLVAAEVLGGQDHDRASHRAGAVLLRLKDEHGSWPCGLPGAGEVPGLFLGRAGIGLTLLRLADRTAAPSPTLPWLLPARGGA